jgi:hypothetical protein
MSSHVGGEGVTHPTGPEPPDQAGDRQARCRAAITITLGAA